MSVNKNFITINKKSDIIIYLKDFWHMFLFKVKGFFRQVAKARARTQTT